jgi:hypothetical protein
MVVRGHGIAVPIPDYRSDTISIDQRFAADDVSRTDQAIVLGTLP